MVVGERLRRTYLVAFLTLTVAIVIPVIVRISTQSEGPEIQLILADGQQRTITLSQMKRLPALIRKGTYQNQFGNWRDEGVYRGVRLTDIIGTDVDYEAIRVIASDGYEIEIDRARVESFDYPMVLSYAFGGVEVPTWEIGFRIAVLPKDGNVGNEEYGVKSAGMFWVQNVTKITLTQSP